MMSPGRSPLALSWLLLSLFLAACATRPVHPARNAFNFDEDTFAFANELVWEYAWDANGRWRGTPRHPKPDFSHRCFVVACAAQQFFQHAIFDPDLPVADDLTYRRLVREVLDSNPRQPRPSAARIRIPGYANLREFSAAQERLLKSQAGGPWLSYFQRGHWRMIFPFSRQSQAKTAHALVRSVQQQRPAVVHVLSFPSLRINHAVLVFDATESADQIRFQTYDPNNPDYPLELSFNKSTRTFHFPTTDYFPGGKINAYQVYHHPLY